MQRTHYGQHGDDCFGCRVLSISFAPSAMPSRRDGAHCAIAKAGDRRLEKDLVAYRSLAEDGMAPKSINGSHEMAMRAESAFEVERGMTATDMAKQTPSYRRGDSDAMRDIAKGAPEFRRRAEEADKALKSGEFAFANKGPVAE